MPLWQRVRTLFARPRLAHFSERVLRDPRFSVLPPDPGPNDPVAIAVKDQLLVEDSVLARVQRLLPSGFALELIGKLLAGPPSLIPAGHHSDDVGIYEVTFPENPVENTPRNIFGLTALLREGLKAHPGAPPAIGRKVSPNHVLVPAMERYAMESHSCPWGPPAPITTVPGLPVGGDPQVKVTVIDSGYQWLSAWGTNPLDPFLASVQPPAEYISTQPPWLPGGGWTAGRREDVLSAGIKNEQGVDVIYALAGHANFIAGVIAQRCPQAAITIVNHNGTFDRSLDDVPTEASVARSLCRSSQEEMPDVIDLGFAFRCFQDVISVVWDVAFEFIGRGTIGNGPLVVCPSGNQGSKRQRYPAALRAFDPRFRNVIAVASATPRKRSAFSNYGRWITCSADGHDVDSTFLPVSNMPVEDDPRGSSAPLNFANGWARWNGTSFAAPKVVGAIAETMAKSPSPMTAVQAWAALSAGVQSKSGLGLLFRF